MSTMDKLVNRYAMSTMDKLVNRYAMSTMDKSEKWICYKYHG